MQVEAPGFPPKIPRLWGKVNVACRDGIYLKQFKFQLVNKYDSTLNTSLKLG
jgi:hypothetical protein